MKTLPLWNVLGTTLAQLTVLPAILVFAFAVLPVRATIVVPPQFADLVSQSDYIVRAVVVSVTFEMRSDGANRRIITKVELDVREVISGTPPQPLVLQMLGGKVGKEEMVVAGTPRFHVGDEDILFVRGNGKQFSPLVALLHGRYPVKYDAKTGESFVTRGDGTPLTNEQEVAQPMVAASGTESVAVMRASRPESPALTPDDFVHRIKAVGAKPAVPIPTKP